MAQYRHGRRVKWVEGESKGPIVPPSRWPVRSHIVTKPGSLWRAPSSFMIDSYYSNVRYKQHKYPYISPIPDFITTYGGRIVVPLGGFGVCLGPVRVEETKQGRVVQIIRHSFMFPTGIYLVSDISHLQPLDDTENCFDNLEDETS